MSDPSADGGYRRTDRATSVEAARSVHARRIRLEVILALLEMDRRHGYDYGGTWDEVTEITNELARSISPRWVELEARGLLELRYINGRALERVAQSGRMQEIHFLTRRCRELLKEKNLVILGSLLKEPSPTQKAKPLDRILRLVSKLTANERQQLREHLVDAPSKKNCIEPFANFHGG